ncbi:hypothetical protein E1286_05915 [Nonomuraea terrae]|uniref:Uncharacterized protein n=1 Tax=Nonomuraea terrae TaxID=2530383 RepID=A0A4R4Z7L0_9ACTN|nr:hypothetical protein [Nonomuraea terrae]TDD54251.1 hypothetical protein E1286_05915 [Nonomuraea terrae]
MAGSDRGRPAGLVLLALGPVLAAAYAGAGHVAVQAAVRAQISGPGWEGGRIDADGMTSLGLDAWRVTWWTALLVGVVALAYVVIGLLLRRHGRGRAFLLVLSGTLIVPYVLGFAVALVNPVKLLASLYDVPDFAAGLPAWHSATAFLLLAAGLAQAVGLPLAAAQGRRAAASRA